MAADGYYFLKDYARDVVGDQDPYNGTGIISVDYVGMNIHAHSDKKGNKSDFFHNKDLIQGWKEFTVADSRMVGKEKGDFVIF